jgi:ribonuclease HI
MHDGVVNLDPLFLANIFIYFCDNQYFQSLLLLFKQILFTFVLFLVFIGSISCGFIQRKQITVQDVTSKQCQNESTVVIEQEEEEAQQQEETTAIPNNSQVNTNDQIDVSFDVLPEISQIISNNFPLEEEISIEPPRQLVCYCDGSYSHQTQTAFSGFRASNGFSKYHRCPRSGSTESEVFAACLALQYAAKYHYDKLILYTDNSKVEQLLKRPKKKDYNNYPKFSKVLNQCHHEIADFRIRVERIRGHPTRLEQQQCATKREFAKVDRKVRQKRRRSERKFNLKEIL